MSNHQTLHHNTHPSKSNGFMSELSSKMNSNVKIQQIEAGFLNKWNIFQHSWFSSVDCLLYLFVAILFFSIGKSFAQFQQKAHERAARNHVGDYSKNYLRTKGKYCDGNEYKLEEPDEERLSTADQSEEMKNTKSDLSDARAELIQMGDELRRLRTKEQSLSAENQILKSKLMQQEQGKDPLTIQETAPIADYVPQLLAPPKSSNTIGGSAQQDGAYDQYDNTYNNQEGNQQYNYENYNYDGYNDFQYNTQQETGNNLRGPEADQEAINDIDQFLDNDDF